MSSGMKVITPVQAFHSNTGSGETCENFGIGISAAGPIPQNTLPSLYTSTNSPSDLSSMISMSIDKELANEILNEIGYSLDADDVVSLLTKTISFYVISSKLTAKENLSQFDVRQLSCFMSHSSFSFGSALTSPQRIDENSKRINEVVSRYQMVLHPIPRDGDCLFTSIIYALDKATKPAKFCEY